MLPLIMALLCLPWLPQNWGATVTTQSMKQVKTPPRDLWKPQVIHEAIAHPLSHLGRLWANERRHPDVAYRKKAALVLRSTFHAMRSQLRRQTLKTTAPITYVTKEAALIMREHLQKEPPSDSRAHQNSLKRSMPRDSVLCGVLRPSGVSVSDLIIIIDLAQHLSLMTQMKDDDDKRRSGVDRGSYNCCPPDKGPTPREKLCMDPQKLQKSLRRARAAR